MQKPWHIPTFDVFVGNLPGDTDQKKIAKYFTHFGEIHAIIVRDSNTEGKKLAYVKFLCTEDADKAVLECQNIDINGSRIIVKRADRKKAGPDRYNNDMFRNKFSSGLKTDQGLSSNSQSKDYPEEMVMVTHVESANTVWSQIVTEDNLGSLVEITEQMLTLCPAAPKLVGTPEINKIYGAQFSEDQQWYRCRVKQSFGTDRVKVLYIDYGNTEEINPLDLVEIPGNLSTIKPFAIRMALNNVRVQDVYDKKAIAFLKKLAMTDGKYIRAIMKRKLSDQSGYFSELYLDGVCLNDQMVDEGFASYRLEMKRHGGFGAGVGAPMEREFASEKGAGDTNGPFPQRAAFEDVNKMSNSGRSTPNTDMNHVSSGPDLRPELNAKIQELQKVKFEKEKINGELTNLRSRMKVLQNEFSSVSSKMMDSSTNNQFRTALEMASKVKQLRCQFPTLQKTTLDLGLELCNGEHRIESTSVKSLPEVLSTLSKYRSAQKEICLLKDTTTLDSLLHDRDAARAEAVNVLDECVKELELLPLADRADAIQDALSKIRKYYDSYFKFSVKSCPALHDLMPTFIEWKQKRMSEFTEARKMTDFCQKATMAALSSVQSHLSFDNLEDFEQIDCDLELLIRQYIQGMHQEITVTDAECSSDGSFLAALVQSLFKELQSEMSNIENFQRLHREFQTMSLDCQPWLVEKPCTAELQGVRKTLRGLKSKLRHRVADCQDLEENECDSGELEDIKQDINAIRKEIHQSLGIEDKLVNDLAKTADVHFPELMKLHPEMGIDTYLEFNGLVKPSHEIEHFDLSSVEGASHGLFKSVFSGSPIFIREHLLKDGDRLDKDEFINQVMTYAGEKLDTLQTIQSVFFDKNARHAYICTPNNGDLLCNIVQRGTKPDQKTIQMIVRCIVKSLQSLHSRNIVHGEITPQNILILDENRSAVLLEPDFSQTMKERSRKKYSTSSGMVFQAPELKNAMLKDVFPATDMYNLGLLVLWLHYPEVHFGLNADAPDFTTVPLDKSVQVVLSSLLNCLPHLRVAANMLMTSEYISQTITESVPDTVTELTPDTKPMPEPTPLPAHAPTEASVPLPPEPEPEAEPEVETAAAHPPSNDYDVMANIGAFDPSCLQELGPDQNQSNEETPVEDQIEPVPTGQFAELNPTESHTVPDGEGISESNGATVVNGSIAEVPAAAELESDFKPSNEATPGLKELMSTKSESSHPEKFNLVDVLRGISHQNSFLKEDSSSSLSVLLNASEPKNE